MVNYKRIKAERIAFGLTQEEMAIKMGISKYKYCKFEKGQQVGADDLVLFSRIVGVGDLGVFFNQSEELCSD